MKPETVSAILRLAQELTWGEWQKIVVAVDREFEYASHQLQLSQRSADQILLAMDNRGDFEEVKETHFPSQTQMIL